MNKIGFLAFALLHASIPAICIINFGASPFWLIGNLLFATATLRSLNSNSSKSAVIVLCFTSGIIFTLSLMLGTSYYMQGEGFNDLFFYHFNFGSLIIAVRSYDSVFIPSLLSLLLAFLAPFIIHKTSTQSFLTAIPAPLLWILALAGSYPFYSLGSYQSSLTADTYPQVKELAVNQADIGYKPKNRAKKNIIFIYAESLEALYFDKNIFGELLPNIRELSANAHRFTNLTQEQGTSWTIAGIVASQCGFPLRVSNHLASNSTIASVEKPYPDEVCLADILSVEGYKTVFMGGAPLWFGGKGNFLKTHGYARVYGYKELLPMLEDKQYKSGWGIYDDSLFDLALDKLKLLEGAKQNYFLTLLTLDTHHPNGIPSKSCKKLVDNRDSMSNAIFCSDQLISSFITEAMNVVDMNKTIIVLFSDHLSLRNTLWGQLQANKQNRRLNFMIFDHAPGTVSNIAGTHFDVAPTVLESAGLTDQLAVGTGFSLYSRHPENPKPTNLVRELKIAPALLNQQYSATSNGVAISRQELSISIGELTLKANEAGQQFDTGMYLVSFNNEGNAVDAIYSDNYPELAKNLNGTFVVGISIHSSQPDTIIYFYGRISPDGKGMTQRVLNDDSHISKAEIIKNL